MAVVKMFKKRSSLKFGCGYILSLRHARNHPYSRFRITIHPAYCPRVRELNVYCEIHPFNKIPEINKDIKGVILSGSPFSVRDEDAPVPDLENIRGKNALLGVCYGAQYMAQFDGGEVLPSEIREYGRANLGYIHPDSVLMKGMSETARYGCRMEIPF